MYIYIYMCTLYIMIIQTLVHRPVRHVCILILRIFL